MLKTLYLLVSYQRFGSNANAVEYVAAVLELLFKAPVEVINARFVPELLSDPTLGATIPVPIGVCEMKLELAISVAVHTPYGIQNCVT